MIWHILNIHLLLQSLNTGLHRLEMAPVKAILRQSPRHHTTQLLGHNNIRKLAGDKLSRVPSPEDLLLGIPVPLSTQLLVCDAVLHRVLEIAAHVGRLESDGTGLARVAAVGGLELCCWAANGGGAVEARSGFKPFGVKGKAEVDLAGREAALDVGADRIARVGDATVVSSCVHSAHHEIVSHDL